MSASDVIKRILKTPLPYADLKFCLVDENKKPKKINGDFARPNKIEDFADFDTISHCTNLDSYSGIGISIQASNICAIDVDKCFSVANDINSADDRALSLLEKFIDCAYCEFSFSGKGLRILFKQKVVQDYSDDYYIKNESKQIEYYQPNKSFRYVTVTGNVIADNPLYNDLVSEQLLFEFLNEYMLKPKREHGKILVVDENRSINELQIEVKRLYFKNSIFQNLWFGKAPGSGHNESELDYQLLCMLYENITQNKDSLKILFENSEYFKSKDNKHINKWQSQNFRYYNYIYNTINRRR